jgi:hypothetical protein
MSFEASSAAPAEQRQGLALDCARVLLDRSSCGMNESTCVFRRRNTTK